MKLKLFKVLKWDSHPTTHGRDRWLITLAGPEHKTITVGAIHSHFKWFKIHLFSTDLTMDYSNPIKKTQLKEAVLLLFNHSKMFLNLLEKNK